ncbi:hypothetical protein SAMN04488103_104137 [Gemmobacter aquatilis]|uniref:Tellurium resistance protein n=1 Tax=Gemmobacter aquatilis TaxID=933059 RepID=A0A1H8FE46_9RHOB|nr:TrgA family protein [Gemmobacter aquatilis]SEN29999.1 hypothetical protein SAMN04488103_104137 [Gemmobacter aquatilis]
MPTAGKLVGALLFAVLGYVTAEVFKPGMPPGTAFGYFSFICAGLGALCGWLVMGKRAGMNFAGVFSAGLQTALVLAFAALFGFSTYLMIGKSLRKLYDGPFEAVIGIFELMIEHGVLMLTPPVLMALLIGGPVCGVITGWFGRRWS